MLASVNSCITFLKWRAMSGNIHESLWFLRAITQSFQLEDLLQLLKKMWTHFAWFHHKAFHLQITKMRQNFQWSLIVFIFPYSVLASLHAWEYLWPEENCNSSLNHHSVFYRTAIIHKPGVRKHHPRHLHMSQECFFQMEICGQDLSVNFYWKDGSSVSLTLIYCFLSESGYKQPAS